MAATEDRNAPEASLLRAISQDATALGSSGCCAELLSLKVGERVNDATNTSVFYHPVTSFGLNSFRVGDTAVQLARRNRKHQAAECLATLYSGCGVPCLSQTYSAKRVWGSR